jgi:diacylglycerol kinase (ATP)
VEHRDVCIICNPSAGRGRALKRMEPIRRHLGPRVDFQETSEAGHAEELAFAAAQNGYAVIGAAGGDGTAHEVANGLLRSKREDVCLAIFPVGSANDYAFALRLANDWWKNGEVLQSGQRVDVGVARAPGGRERFFINGVGFGFQAAVTIESRKVTGLQGVPLYTLALFRALIRHYHFPKLEIAIDGVAREAPTLGFSAALGNREGNFLIAPDARLDDGLFDFIRIGTVHRWEMVRYVPGMITGKLPIHHPQLTIGRCRTVRVHGQTPLPIHLDGEVFSRPEDGVCDLELELLPGALKVLGFAGRGEKGTGVS